MKPEAKKRTDSAEEQIQQDREGKTPIKRKQMYTVILLLAVLAVIVILALFYGKEVFA